MNAHAQSVLDEDGLPAGCPGQRPQAEVPGGRFLRGADVRRASFALGPPWAGWGLLRAALPAEDPPVPSSFLVSVPWSQTRAVA